MSLSLHTLRAIRERLTRSGAEALSDLELVALVMADGTNGRSLNMAERTLERAGGVAGLAQREVAELVGVCGMGATKACLLKAAVELGRRAAAPAPPTGKSITCSSDVAHWFRCRLQDCDRECLHALLLDSKHRLLRSMRVTEGSWNACPVDPKVVLSACLRHRAPDFILVHNHPSGDPTPSRDDLELTDRMVRAGRVVGVRLLDHLIVAREGFFSLADAGLL